MERFGADWLALREPADHAARAHGVTDAVVRSLGPDQPATVLDLATGTGSNIRQVMPRVPGAQEWLAVDGDEALLLELPARVGEWARVHGFSSSRDAPRVSVHGESFACDIAVRAVDLSLPLSPALFAGRRLVTASALLDLVSESWLDDLAERCRECGAAVLFALNYDGMFRCSPEVHADELVRTLVNRHQRTDKGFGPALGADAAAAAERLFSSRGYVVRRERSDWIVSASAPALQRALIDGWAAAAADIDPAAATSIRKWRDQRLRYVTAGQSTLIVGHEDVGGWLSA
jgi:hypothetical protein